jgi:hypothetical protein
MPPTTYRVLKPLRYARAIQPPGTTITPDPAEARALLRAGLIAPLPAPAPAPGKRGPASPSTPAA